MPAQLALALVMVLLVAASVLFTAYGYERRNRIADTNRYRAERDAAREAAAADRAELARVTEQRNTLGDRLTETRKASTRQAKQIEELTRRLKNVERADRNPLYREAMEDKQAVVVQAAMQIKLAQESLDAAKRVLGGNKE